MVPDEVHRIEVCHPLLGRPPSNPRSSEAQTSSCDICDLALELRIRSARDYAGPERSVLPESVFFGT